MTQGAERFIRLLENAAKRADIMPPAEASTLLRRAALRLRNSDGFVPDPEVDEAFERVCRLTNTPRNDLVSMIIRDWLVANGHLPSHSLNENIQPVGVV